MANPGEVTQLLLSWSQGDASAFDRLAPLVYRELRRMAAGYLRRERTGHTLQPTELVHEAYVRLIDQSLGDCRTRAQFFGIAANLMRQILVNHAKRRLALKRGRGNVTVISGEGPDQPPLPIDLIALDAALERLAQRRPRQGKVVELRFFGGLTEDEIAEVLKVSSITVKRDWRIARAVLYRELTQGPGN